MESSDIEGELERLHDACWGWALACCGRDRDVAEEALQSAYARVISGQARFDGKSQFRTWLFGVIRYAALEGSTTDTALVVAVGADRRRGRRGSRGAG